MILTARSNKLHNNFIFRVAKVENFSYPKMRKWAKGILMRIFRSALRVTIIKTIWTIVFIWGKPKARNWRNALANDAQWLCDGVLKQKKATLLDFLFLLRGSVVSFGGNGRRTPQDKYRYVILILHFAFVFRTKERLFPPKNKKEQSEFVPFCVY